MSGAQVQKRVRQLQSWLRDPTLTVEERRAFERELERLCTDVDETTRPTWPAPDCQDDAFEDPT